MQHEMISVKGTNGFFQIRDNICLFVWILLTRSPPGINKSLFQLVEVFGLFSEENAKTIIDLTFLQSNIVNDKMKVLHIMYVV